MTKRWTPEEIQRLRDLAPTVRYASDIAAQMGSTQHAIITQAGRYGINVINYTPEQQTMMDARYRAREMRKYQKRKEVRRENGYAPKPKRAVNVSVELGTSQSSPIYRNQLPRIGEISKDRMREMIAQAVRNTAEMQINA